MAPETICGAATYPAVDDPEILPFPRGDGTVEYRRTGNLLPRGYDDPYCPRHGGTEEPAPEPVTLVALQSAYENYLELASRYKTAATAAVPDPYQIATGQAPIGHTPESQLAQLTDRKSDNEQ